MWLSGWNSDKQFMFWWIGCISACMRKKYLISTIKPFSQVFIRSFFKRRTVWRFLKKRKIELPSWVSHIAGRFFNNWATREAPERPYYPAIKLYAPDVHCCAICNRQAWKQPRCPSTDGWIKQTCGAYRQWNATQPLEKSKIKPCAATQMGLEIIILSEVSQTD